MSEASGGGNDTGAYYVAAFDGANFWAAGSGGRIARITLDNEVELQSCPTGSDLHDLCWENGSLLACGEDGAVVCQSDDGTLRAPATGTTADLLAATVFQGSYYVAGEDGILLTSSDGQKWTQRQLPVSSDVIGLDANDETLFAITRGLDYLVSRLPQVVPEKPTQLIFYCGIGKRAQTALEVAKDLGYQQVYNLGGIDNWPYGLE